MHQYPQQSMVVDCDAPGCDHGYIGDQYCGRCDGNGRIIVPEPPHGLRVSVSVIVYVLFVIGCGTAIWIACRAVR